MNELSLETICQNTLDALETNSVEGFFENRTLTIEHRGFKKEVHNISGWEENGEIAFDPRTDSAQRYSQACQDIVQSVG